jgi:hypothetical protein
MIDPIDFLNHTRLIPVTLDLHFLFPFLYQIIYPRPKQTEVLEEDNYLDWSVSSENLFDGSRSLALCRTILNHTNVRMPWPYK